MEVDINVQSNIAGTMGKLKKRLEAVPKEGLREFVALTPVRSGNARRHTYLSGDKIVAGYPYAERLDNGWSKQAPQGMSKPFELWLQKKYKSIFGK